MTLRDLDRFPSDFSFQVTQQEFNELEVPVWHLKFLLMTPPTTKKTEMGYHTLMSKK